MKTRKKDIRTVRKEMKAIGFQNIKWSTWRYHHETFGSLSPLDYKMFLEGDNKEKCDWAKSRIKLLTGGECNEDEILALEIDGVKLLEFANPYWIDGSKRNFNEKNIA